MNRIKQMFELSTLARCPGEVDCEDYQGAADSSCLMEYDGQLVDIGAYQACMQCEKLSTKPLVQLQRMADAVPDERLQQYRSDADVDLLADQIEQLAERHKAGWQVPFGELEYWEAQLLMFWLNAERQMERIMQQSQQLMTQALIKALVQTRM